MVSVLRVPGVGRLFAASCIGRLPMGALGLLLVLHTRQVTGSYGAGGLAAGAYAIALAISNPLLGRIVDRTGQTLVLRVGAPIAAAAIVAIALLPDGAPLGLILLVAALVGIAQPPTGAMMRALWPVLLAGDESRHSAYALEGVALEIVYICGPLLIVAGIGSWSIPGAILACAVFVAVGDLIFSAQRPSREWRPHDERAPDRTGALRGPGVRVLVAAFGLAGLALGAVEVAVPAALEGMHHRDLTGVLLGLWGVGSMTGGLLTSRFGPGANPPRRLAVLLAAWGVGHAVLGAAGVPWVLAGLLLVAGVTIAPAMTCGNSMLDRLAPTGTLTEAFTWASTGLVGGMAAGNALAGGLVESASPAVAFAALGGGGVLAAFVVRASAAGPLRPTLPAVA